MKNYTELRSLSLRYKKYIFVDTDRYFYREIFLERGIRIKAIKEMIRDGLPYKLILCKVMKRDEERFVNALEQVQSKSLLLGDRGYMDMCEMLTSFESRLQEANG